MNPWLGALGGAASGFGATYSKIADEQRQFNIDQFKADAQYNRQLNLSRAQKGMENSGVLDENGLPLTNDEYRNASPETRAALKGPIVQAGEIQKIKEMDQPSQYMTADRRVLTKGELAEYIKESGGMEGLITVGAQNRADRDSELNRQEAREDKRFQNSLDLQGEKERAADERQKANIDQQSAKQKENVELAERKMEASKKKDMEEIDQRDFRKIRAGLESNAKTVEKEFKDSPENFSTFGLKPKEALSYYKIAAKADTLAELSIAYDSATYNKFLNQNPELKDTAGIPIAAKLLDSGVSPQELVTKHRLNPQQAKTILMYGRINKAEWVDSEVWDKINYYQ